jgi:hypothetical protein
MINVQTGEVQLDDCRSVIHPKLTFQEFSNGDISVSRTMSSHEGWNTCYFEGKIDGMDADFVICFRHGEMRFIGWQPKVGRDQQDWCDIPVAEQKEVLTNWLRRVIGTPPYEYEWGVVDMDRDIKTGDFSLIVLYRLEISEREKLGAMRHS